MSLWNRNFSIVTIGSFISALGGSITGVVFGILIYQETQSPLILALFFVANILPRVITSFLVGPYIDRHSRKKIIVTIDYFYTGLFLIMGIVLHTGFFSVVVFTAIGALFGVIDTFYQTAFMSLFQEVITPGNHSRAYSISSLLWPIAAAIMAPVAAYMIDNFEFGVSYLMYFNAALFLVTATIELFINAKETLNQKQVVGRQFVADFKEAILYYKKERGILAITILFVAFQYVYAAQDLLRMPFFVSSATYTLQHYSFLITASAIGRVMGGLIHYTFKYPAKKKFLIAVSVYLAVEFLGATQLYMPYFLMVATGFIVGLLSVAAFNIRKRATQTYIPGEMRGRINSTQNLLWSFGGIIGALVTGLIAEYTALDYRLIMAGAAVVSISAILLIPLRMSGEFKKIYNVDV